MQAPKFVIGRRSFIIAMAATGIGGAAAAKERRPDLADGLAGRWFGNVISDSKGAGRTGVTLTLSRVAPNTVQIESDYERLPVIRVPLQKAMTAIVNRTGDTAFVWKSGHLDVSFHNEVSWAGERAGD